ncbi:MAG: DNA methyltransferase [Verrucomicrobiia bacterium]
MKYLAGINAIQKADTPIHDWYRFVLSYPPHLVRQYIERFGIRGRDLLCDPFCGTGTTLVEAKKIGVRSVGCDAHPFAVLVSRSKTNWSLDVTLLSSLLRLILVRAEEQMIRHGLPALSFYTMLVRESDTGQKNGYRLNEDEEKLLPTGFLSERPLQRLLILRDEIVASTNRHPKEIREFFLLAMAHVIANGAGNFAFGPEIYRTKAKPDYDVLEHFASHVNTMILEMERAQIAGSDEVEAEVFLDDARRLDHIPSGIAAVITSPPYPNEKDYTRTTRVESLLLGILKNREQLRSVKESLLRSNTRNVFVADNDGDEVAEFKAIQAVCQKIESRRVDLKKTSGFEKLYHKVVAHYFGGMRRHFRALRPKLKPKGSLAYVLGDQLSFLMVPIATAELLGEVAGVEGFKVIGRELWRERVGTKIRNSETNQKNVRIREEVLILQKA